MATRSTITLKTEKVYTGIDCHWDGYPSHTGAILLEHYDTEEKVKELIALGSINSLFKKVKPDNDEKHSFCHPAKNVTVAYHRDRGEGCRPVINVYDSLEQIFKGDADYNYVFENGEWELIVSPNAYYCKPLKDVLQDDA